MPSRSVHRVRCRKKDNPRVWADVKVVDALSFNATDGREKLLFVKAKNAVPHILDDTGGSNSRGDPEELSRKTHMELKVSPDDPNQKMYVEVLDALSIGGITPPNDTDRAGQPPVDKKGLTDAAVDGKGEITLIIPSSKASRLVQDSTGLNLGSTDPDKDASRSQHVSLVTENGNTDDKTDDSDAIPPTAKHAWLAVAKTDALAIRATGAAEITLYFPTSSENEIDTTVMTTDPATGEPCPPDNTDPHVYVDFPVDDDPNAPCIGCNVHIPSGGDPIDQGPLWWIERISQSNFNPWFWFATVQTPLAFSYFGGGGALGSWAWRGYVLWNNFPVIWIIARNAPIQPMGQFGSPSLDLCAREGSWEGDLPDLAFGVVLDSFGPFGLLPMTNPPLGPLPDAVPYGNASGGNNGSELWSGIPNIWQLIGSPQPPRRHPEKLWDAFTNPYSPPTPDAAEAAARAFETNWNGCSAAVNSALNIFVPSGHDRPIWEQPPGWQWAVEWHDPEAGILKYGSSFQNSIAPGIGTVAFPIELYTPATCYFLSVDQLDPKIWDTTKQELFANPTNIFFGTPHPTLWPPPPSH